MDRSEAGSPEPGSRLLSMRAVKPALAARASLRSANGGAEKRALRNAGCDPRRFVTCAAVTLRARFTRSVSRHLTRPFANPLPREARAREDSSAGARSRGAAGCRHATRGFLARIPLIARAPFLVFLSGSAASGRSCSDRRRTGPAPPSEERAPRRRTRRDPSRESTQ